MDAIRDDLLKRVTEEWSDPETRECVVADILGPDPGNLLSDWTNYVEPHVWFLWNNLTDREKLIAYLFAHERAKNVDYRD